MTNFTESCTHAWVDCNVIGIEGDGRKYTIFNCIHCGATRREYFEDKRLRRNDTDNK